MAAVIVSGSASISINPQETEARLVFTADPSGDGWDLAAVNKLAMDNQVKIQTDPKTIEGFLHKASKSSEPMELILNQGIEPEEQVAETVIWEALPVPGDMAPFLKEALASAAAPKIFRVRVDKVKHEKTVKKPGALPFMPAREEVVVSWDRKETREEVNVDPDPKEIKYAMKGAKIGTVTPSTPGKPGKSIYGRPIPPRMAGDGTCLLGEGISREKNELSSAVSGFLRIGGDWADIVPLAKHAYEITTGMDGLTLFLNFEPGDARFAPPSCEEILAAARAKGAPESGLVSARQLDEAITEAVKHHESLQAFPLLRPQESEVRIDINPEKTAAVLYLRKGVAGSLPLEMKTISQALKDSGIHGFDAEKLKSAIHEFMSGKELELKDYVLVEGTASTRGKDREIEIAAELLRGDEQKRVLARFAAWRKTGNANGPGIDPGPEVSCAFVEEGQLVANVSAGSEGEPGKDIFGNEIPGLPGNDPDIKLIRGLELSGSEIKAVKDGLLLMSASGTGSREPVPLEKSFRGEVIDYRDAKVAIRISADAMEARGDLHSEEGAGVPLSVENILKVLGTLGVVKGIDKAEVEEACALARAGGSVSGHVLARGQIAIAPGSSAVKWLVSVPSPESAAETAGADEAALSIDTGDDLPVETAAKSSSVQVKAGTPIAELSGPLEKGRPGFDVMGKEISVEGAEALVIEHDDSVREMAVGKGKRLVALRSGDLSYDGRTLKISSEKSISGDAGPATGNINFSGEVKIGGNVLPGCAIIAGSHVIIDGVAEEALISAGGRAIAAMGIKGGGKGIIRARAGIESAFSERASLLAVGDIKLKKGSIRSTIKTNGRLLITDDNGRLSGGICQARRGINAADVGTDKGIRTELSFGQDYLVKDQIGACEDEIIKLRRMLTEIEENIKNALNKKLPLADEVRKEKVKLVKLLEQLNLKVFTLREKFEEHYDSEVRVRGSVFPGVLMESHNRFYEVKQKRSRVIFYFDSVTGSIKEKPLV